MFAYPVQSLSTAHCTNSRAFRRNSMKEIKIKLNPFGVQDIQIDDGEHRRIWHNKISAGQRQSGACMSVRAISSEDPLVEAIRPCEMGRNLLLKFAAARQATTVFLSRETSLTFTLCFFWNTGMG